MVKHLHIWFLLFVLVIGFDASAQRNKKDASPMDVTQLSEDIALKAESTLIEAEKEMILENYSKAFELFQVALGSES